MKNHIENNSYNEIFRGKMDQIDFPYDNSQWERLSKELDSSGISGQGNKSRFSLKSAMITGSIAIAIIAGILYFTPPQNNDTEKLAKTTQNNEINKQSQDLNTKLNQTQESTQSVTEPKIIEIAKSEKNQLQETKSNIENSIIPQKREDQINIDVVDLKENITKESTNIIQPDARFLSTENEGCAPLRISLNPVMLADSIEYVWDFGDGEFSNEKNPVHTYKKDGNFIISLYIKYPNSGLESFYSSAEEVRVFPQPINKLSKVSTENTYNFKLDEPTDNSIRWSINEQFISNNSEIEYNFNKSGVYNLSCLLENEYSCTLLIREHLNIKITHDIPMPNAFSPNGDGTNDLYGPGQEYYEAYRLELQIYNSKSGELVFKNTSNTLKWDGKMLGKGINAPNGVYAFILKSSDEFGNIDVQKGSVTLVR